VPIPAIAAFRRLWPSKLWPNRAGPLGGAKPTILPGVGVALAARGSCSYRGWYIYLKKKYFTKNLPAPMYFDIIPIQISSLNYCIFGHGVLGTTRAVLLRSAPQKHQVESLFCPLLLRPSVDVTFRGALGTLDNPRPRPANNFLCFQNLGLPTSGFGERGPLGYPGVAQFKSARVPTRVFWPP
jgi:hypothetical protein